MWLSKMPIWYVRSSDPAKGRSIVPVVILSPRWLFVKLYKVTGDEKYLQTAKYFVEETGRGTDGHKLSEYSQDHKPILQQDEIVGHAVRAGYLYPEWQM